MIAPDSTAKGETVDPADRFSYLAQFLGPKGENAEVMEELLITILRDHVHWRRNYFPDDKPLLTPSRRRALEDGHDRLEAEVVRQMAELRRNFPFFSPRYIGHQLSDVSMPSLLGYFAGMLYNPNNVTSEASPVTAGWELDACARVLTMLGYTPPPEPPDDAADVARYESELQQIFGFAHITSGGTIANVEALWVARNVRYGVLAVKDAAAGLGLSVPVTRPDGTATTLAKISHRDLLGIAPSEALLLKERLATAYLDSLDVEQAAAMKDDEVSAVISRELEKSGYDLRTNWARCAAEFPPVILTSGAAHYSVRKAADILGIGGDRVLVVPHDKHFRVDVKALEKMLARHGRRRSKSQELVSFPLAVVAVAGTTEEGAVDPVHEVLRLRAEMEKQRGMSFWVHVDAAWGGFFRSLFVVEEPARSRRLAQRLGASTFGVPCPGGDLSEWHERLADAVARRDGSSAPLLRLKLDESIARGDYDAHREALLETASVLGVRLARRDLEFTRTDLRAVLHDYTADEVTIRVRDTVEKVAIGYKSLPVLRAFEAFSEADSITVDPHKMGYVGYPSGVVAFRDDRVRHSIAHEAPYITSSTQVGAAIHQPPKHVDLKAPMPAAGVGIPVNIKALAPYMMEGSKPGAAAAALDLATTTLPLTMHEHGAVVRSTVLAARHLFEWLARWDRLRTDSGWPSRHPDYRVVTCTPEAPDTNLVTFVMVPRPGCTLEEMNSFSKAVYQAYAIQVEFGARDHSYGQPFFLSNTTFKEPNYPTASIEPLLKRCRLQRTKGDYETHGVVVVRASVMNPYITPLREAGLQDVCQQFVFDLDAKAEAALDVLQRGQPVK